MKAKTTSTAIMSQPLQKEFADEAKSWILEHYDAQVVAASEINYRLNDEICCTRVINQAGTFKGILTLWKESGAFKNHFDKH